LHSLPDYLDTLNPMLPNYLDKSLPEYRETEHEVRGLEGRYVECLARGLRSATGSGIKFVGLCDQDMLACQEALPPGDPP
ncbi:MAG: hypothetical protein KGS61_00665, partial [Verrucomicrobia bacterium]|nr:hypothetical protein [Verrucomicrobiota bacterium]